jgi:hypothetical protein
MSVRGGLQTAAGTLRRAADSLRGGSVRGGSVRGGSLHAAVAALRDITAPATPAATAPPLQEDVLEMASATVTVLMPPAEWPGWRPVTADTAAQAEPPAVLLALHAATACERTRGGSDAQLAVCAVAQLRPDEDAPQPVEDEAVALFAVADAPLPLHAPPADVTRD